MLLLRMQVRTRCLPVVVQKRLQIFVAVNGGAGESKVVGAQRAHILEVLVLDELDDDVLLGLDLEHLEHEAEEGSRLYVSAVNSANVSQLHGLLTNIM